MATERPAASGPAGTDGPAPDAAQPAQDEKALWWRAVLGEYPTGVCLLAARANSELFAMVVGTFTAISQDPPLVGVFVDHTSTTFPHLASAGGFTVSVLGAAHEQLSRDIAAKSPDRFARASFVDGESGHPHLADAVAWFDTVIERREQYGDHDLVVARVTDFGVGAAAAELPLLFRRAGYGTFAAPSEPYDMRSFVARLHVVQQAGGELQRASDELGLPITVNTQIGDSVVTVGVVSPFSAEVDTARIGRSFPFAAPVAPVFAAWATPEQRHAWTEGSRHLVGRVERAQIARQLEGVRARGYGLVGRRPTGARFDTLFAGSTPRIALAQTWEEMLALGGELEGDPEQVWRRASGIQIPVFGADGHVILALYATALPQLEHASEFDALVRRLVEAAHRISELLGRTD